jgi:hypothetical protein
MAHKIGSMRHKIGSMRRPFLLKLLIENNIHFILHFFLVVWGPSVFFFTELVYMVDEWL